MKRSIYIVSGLLVAIGLVAAAEPPDPSTYESTQDAVLHKADLYEKARQYGDAIPIYERLLQNGGGRDPHWTAYVLFRLACAQYQVGDRMGAMESASTAATLDPAEPSYKAFENELSNENPDRHKPVTYHARRDQGSARRLSGTNGVLHIYVRGRNTLPWETEDKEKTQAHIEVADQWLKLRAEENKLPAPPTFVHRYLSLTEEPFWRRIDVPDSDSTREYRAAWLQAILVRFNAETYADLFDRTFDGMDVDNRTVVFHTSTRDISLSVLQPFRKLPTDLESTLTPTEMSGWVDLYESVCYTHELLHLYGADDLFDKAQDPAAPETDVMNFGAHRLEECVMSPLTRYAIGWTPTPPRLTVLHLDEGTTHTKRKRGLRG